VSNPIIMFSFFLAMLFWWLIHFAHYYLSKQIVTGISEEKLIEIMTTPLFFQNKYRKHKKYESYAVAGILIGYFPVVWLYTRLFIEIQRIVLPIDGVNFSGGFLILPAIVLAAGTMVYFIFKVAGIGTISSEKWSLQPSFKNCQERLQKIKVSANIMSWIIQALFLCTMLFYTNVGDKGITNSGFFDFGTKFYPYSEVAYVETYMKSYEVTTKSGGKRKQFSYFYTVKLHNGKKIELWNDLEFGWNEAKVEKLKQAIVYFRENKVPVKVDYPSFLDWSDYKKELSAVHYQKVKNYFDEVRDLAEGVSKIIPIGKFVEIDSSLYRIDSITTDLGTGFGKAPEGQKYLHVYMTVQNQSDREPLYINTLNLSVFDQADNSYYHSFFGKDTFEPEIPPKATHSGSFNFQIANDPPLPLRLRYEKGVLDSRDYWFQLTAQDKKIN
jgi:hypothetical protein